jgi:hypothetical protein
MPWQNVGLLEASWEAAFGAQPVDVESHCDNATCESRPPRHERGKVTLRIRSRPPRIPIRPPATRSARSDPDCRHNWC